MTVAIAVLITSVATFTACDKQGYVDLGLPSGTKWQARNESGQDFYTYDEAVAQFGNKLPTKEQCEELINSCQWQWTGSGYKVTGPNRNHITLPAAGICSWNGSTYGVGSDGRYWSSEPSGSDLAWGLGFHSGEVYMYSNDRYLGYSVRLVEK